MIQSNYIFFTGAPGSTWSTVYKAIYWSPDVDHSDYMFDKREYKAPTHINDTTIGPHHTGAYWDPGMEFELGEWDKPFTGTGIRIIKSHSIAKNLDSIKYEYKTSPIVMVWSDSKVCMRRWLHAGGWDITYPIYKPYFKNNEKMIEEINLQNEGIEDFTLRNKDNIIEVFNTRDLTRVLNIRSAPKFNPLYPSENLFSNNTLKESGVKIFVYLPRVSCK